MLSRETISLDPRVRPADPARGSTLESQKNENPALIVASLQWIWMNADTCIYCCRSDGVLMFEKCTKTVLQV